MTISTGTLKQEEKWFEEFNKRFSSKGMYPMGLYIAEAAKDFIHKAREEAKREERERILEKWRALKIQAGAACGSAIGVITHNSFGEIDGMQVKRKEYLDFISSLTSKEEGK